MKYIKKIGEDTGFGLRVDNIGDRSRTKEYRKGLGIDVGDTERTYVKM